MLQSRPELVPGFANQIERLAFAKGPCKGPIRQRAIDLKTALSDIVQIGLQNFPGLIHEICELFAIGKITTPLGLVFQCGFAHFAAQFPRLLQCLFSVHYMSGDSAQVEIAATKRPFCNFFYSLTLKSLVGGAGQGSKWQTVNAIAVEERVEALPKSVGQCRGPPGVYWGCQQHAVGIPHLAKQDALSLLAHIVG